MAQLRPISGTVNVAVDGSGRLGPLSYLVPEGSIVCAGQEVEVPFGKVTKVGIVIGPGDASKATRAINAVVGQRAEQADVEYATQIAKRNFVEVTKVLSRLTPTAGLDVDPIAAEEVVLAEGPSGTDIKYPVSLLNHRKRLLLTAPAIETTRVAALEASHAAKEGQVLILCPTKVIAGQVAAQFETGAARLDIKLKKDDLSPVSAFAQGTLKIGIGTRAAALWPAPHLKTIIVVDEDHPGHVEAAMPNTNAVEVAAGRADTRNCERGRRGRIATSTALATGAKVGVVGDPATHWPTFEVLDTTNYPPSQRILPPDVERALDQQWSKDQIPVLITPAAKTTVRCSKCKVERASDDKPCIKCNETKTLLSGNGPERVEAMFRQPVNAVSMGEVRTVTNANLVVIMSLDSAHHIPSLVPDRPAASLILEAARIAGAQGKVIICTDDDKHQVITDVVRMRDLSRNAKTTWATAKELGLPPYGRLVTIRVGRPTKPNTSKFPGQVLGPRRDGNEWEILIRIPDDQLHLLEKPVEDIRRGGKVRIAVS